MDEDHPKINKPFVFDGALSKARFKADVAIQPRTVSLGFSVIDIRDLNTAAGTVHVEFYLYARWIDPYMIGMGPGGPFGRTADEYETLWNPKLEVNTGIDMECLLGPDASWNLKNPETGEMKYTQRYRGLISVEGDLRRFPFDKAEIAICIGCEFYGADKVVLEQDENVSLNEKTLKHKLSDWDVKRNAIRLVLKDHIVTSSKKYSNITYLIPVSRKYMFYVWKVLFINMMMLVWSWSVFWMDPDAIGGRMSLTLTLFLANVAFLFVVSDKLPRVDYLTIMDKIMLMTFLLLFLSAFESFVVFTSPSASQHTIDYVSRIGFPVASVLTVLYYFIRALYFVSTT